MTDMSRGIRRILGISRTLPITTLVGFGLAFSAALVVGLASYGALRGSVTSAQRVAHSLEVIETLQQLLSTVKDAETGQRGFVLTGEDRYLEPYTRAGAALEAEMAAARSLLAAEPEQLRLLQSLTQECSEKMAELAHTIELYRHGDRNAALELIRTDRGVLLMERIAATTLQMTQQERRALSVSQPRSFSDARVLLVIIVGGSALVIALIGAAALRASRDYRAGIIQAWIRAGQAELGEHIQGHQDPQKLVDAALGFLVRYLGAQSGAVYLNDTEGRFRNVAGREAVGPSDPAAMVHRDRLVERAAKNNRMLYEQWVPAGNGTTAKVVLAPASAEGVVHAVISLEFASHSNPAGRELLSRISESLALAIKASTTTSKLSVLQLEAQLHSAALRTQQTEIEKSNSQLEAQAKILKLHQDQLSIFNSANFAGIATDANGVITIFNVGAERMLGYTAEEVVDKLTPADISDPQELIRRSEALSSELEKRIAPGFGALVFKAAHGVEDIFELTYIRKDGGRLPAMVSVTAQRDAGGVITGYLLIGTDNSARKRAEQELVNAGGLESAIFNSVKFCKIATDAKGVIQIFNVGAERMLGYKAAEVLNRLTPADFSDPQQLIGRAEALSVEMHAQIAPGLEALVFKAARGIEDIYEVTYIRKDGSRLPVMVSVTALRDADGVIIGYLLIGTDNTARRQIEAEHALLAQRLLDNQFYIRSLFESNIDALMTTNASGVITDANRQAETLTGRTREELLGAPFKSLFTEPRRAEAGIQLALGSRKVIDYELTARDKNGKETVVSYNATTFHDQHGKLQGVFAAVRSISERKQYELSLREATHKAEHANSAKSEFLANMSHEIRTPLNAVIGLGYLLEHTALSDNQRQLLNKIQFGGRALLGVINNVLDLSKIEAGEMSLDEEPFDLHEVVRDVSQMLAPQAVAKGIDLILQSAPTLPHMVNGDASRLRQVLTNLVGNSIKFTESGHVQLQVYCTEQNSERIRLRCTVQDTGIGIEPAALERLFTPFTQADASTTRRFGGTGLGLSIARRLVDLMGGEIGVESTPGVGSTFWFEIPVRIPQNSDGRVGARALRILIAESRDTARENLMGMARALGWNPQAAETGEELLGVMNNTKPSAWPDVLIIERQLHDMDAYELVARMEKECSHGRLPPAIVVGDVEQTDSEKSQLLRTTDALLVRPVTSSTLFNAVDGAVSKSPNNIERLLQITKFDDLNAQWLAGVRVLVVDDSDINLEVAQRILEKQGAIVTTCSDGLAAVESVRSGDQPLDIVLMDVQMPLLDGNEATRRIRNDLHLRALPIVALTAGALVGERQRALEAGMNDFISKPFDPPALIRKIRMIVEQARGAPIPLVMLDARATAPTAVGPLMASLDAGIVQQMFGDDVTLFRSLLARVLREFADFAAPGSMALDNPLNRSRTKARAHKLKGSAGVIGAAAVVRLASDVEEALEQDRPNDVVEPILARLALALACVQEEADLIVERQPDSAPDTAALAAMQTSIGAGDIDELCELLESHNLAAIDRFKVLSKPLSERLGSVRFARLRAAVDDLEFELGAELVRQARVSGEVEVAVV
jgi:PAS domain S-box-containing protein